MTGEKALCPLCERHSKLSTVEGVNFWIELQENGAPVLITDSTTRGGGINVVQVNFCPLCGENLIKKEDKTE